jgi:hypothetical protein
MSACISFGSTASAQAVTSVTRSMWLTPSTMTNRLDDKSDEATVLAAAG